MSEWQQIHAQIDAIVRAIPEHFLLDPPDGGDVTVAEVVQRMAARIEQLEAALTEIYKKGLHNQGGAYKNGFYDCFKIARRALGIPHMSFDAARAALGERT